VKIRISAGVGSSPKLWAVLGGKAGSQVGEFDLGEPGRYDAEANGISGMSGIVWKRGRIAETHPRKLYGSVDEWVADVAAEYPGAEIERADDKPQDWL
jgi:hypothetical protein